MVTFSMLMASQYMKFSILLIKVLLTVIKCEDVQPHKEKRYSEYIITRITGKLFLISI